MSELLAAERKKVLELEVKLVEAKRLVTKFRNIALNVSSPYTALRVLEIEINKL